jgi:hypothetical protein
MYLLILSKQHLRIAIASLLWILLMADVSLAQTGNEAPAPAAAKTPASTDSSADDKVSASQLLDMLKQQSEEMKKQRGLIDAQMTDLKEQHETMKSQSETISRQAEQLNNQRQAIQQLQTRVDEIQQKGASDLSQDEVAMRTRLETLEDSVKSSRDEASTSFTAESFPGSISIPGSTSALKIGGFVKMNIVQSFNAIGTSDRFIVGTIPTESTSSTNETSLTVSQSRLNFDFRDRTGKGVMRAFIEADFAGDDDTFRLRHAFGQYRDLLAGKTHSTFMDVEATPEELDFEGINGRINVRQTELRYFPKIGKDWNLLLALEDPQPDVTGGDGVSQIPDLVASVRRTWFDRWHIKTGLLFRNLKAEQTDPDTGDVIPGISTESTIGWGLVFSGKTAVPLWDKRDNFMFQLSGGEGYGRYVNDLGSIGGQDAVYDPEGKLEALPVFAGYLAFQKWWGKALRSKFIASWVNIDTYDYQPDDAYQDTQRVSGNVIFSPTAKIDIGTELLWGRREDKDGSDGSAMQMQISAKYRF